MNKKIIPSILGLVVILIALWMTFAPKLKTNQNGQQGITASTTIETYTNETYGFSLNHPSDWTVTEDRLIPFIAVHKKVDPAGTTYGLHGNATQVVIYPKGLGTEPPQSQTNQTSISFLDATTTLTDFFLKDGSLWAEFVSIKNGGTAKGWSKEAFLWAGLAVKDPQVVCVLKDGIEKPADSCDMGVEFNGAKYIKTGTTNQQDGPVLEAILRSLSFTK
jgi:hypothetical protein